MRMRPSLQILTLVLVCLAMVATAVGCEWYFAQYWLTITVKAGQGTTNPSPGRHGPYSFDHAVSVSATPAAGWILQKMVEDHDGDSSEHTMSPATVRMDRRSREVAVDVYFAQSTPTYYVSSSTYYKDTQNPCDGTVTLAPTGGTYNQGTTVTITCTPAAGMNFVKMVIYGETSERNWVLLKTVDASNTTTVDVNCNIAVEAHFENQ